MWTKKILCPYAITRARERVTPPSAVREARAHQPGVPRARQRALGRTSVRAPYPAHA